MAQQQTAKPKYETGQADFQFGGFKNLNSTPIPDEFFDLLAVKLSEAELRVLLYIMRRTFGFKKTGDAISLSQLTEGIRRRDGSVLDYGTGLSKPSVLKAVGGLQAKGIITIEKRTGYDGRNEVNVYQLRFQTESANKAQETGNFYNDDYSKAEYSSHKQDNLPHPDPQFVSAQPGASDSQVEQRRSGEVRKPGVSKAAGAGMATGGKQVNQGGKGSLPIGSNDTGRGKVALPGGLSKRDYQGKAGNGEGVKMVNQQESSLQNFSRQKTAQQVVLRAQGALALQDMSEPEAVEVEVDGDQLYISFRKLVLAMVDLGLSEKLANEVAYAYPEEYLWEKIELTRQQISRSSHQRTLRNVAGYLRRAIEEDYQPRIETVAGSGREVRGYKRQFPQAEAFFGSKREAEPVLEEDVYTYPKEDTAPLPPIYRADRQGPATGGIGPFTAPVSYSGLPARSGRSSGGAGARGGLHIPSEDTRSDNRWPNEVAVYEQERREGLGSTGWVSGAGRGWSKSQQDIDGQREATGSLAGSERLYEEVWARVGEDLTGRFRLETELGLLEGSWLWLEAGSNREAEAVVMVRWPWQLRGLGPVVRNAVGMALRQHLGPGYVVRFELAG